MTDEGNTMNKDPIPPEHVENLRKASIAIAHAAFSDNNDDAMSHIVIAMDYLGMYGLYMLKDLSEQEKLALFALPPKEKMN